jgi:hypothetical protein
MPKSGVTEFELALASAERGDNNALLTLLRADYPLTADDKHALADLIGGKKRGRGRPPTNPFNQTGIRRRAAEVIKAMRERTPQLSGPKNKRSHKKLADRDIRRLIGQLRAKGLNENDIADQVLAIALRGNGRLPVQAAIEIAMPWIEKDLRLTANKAEVIRRQLFDDLRRGKVRKARTK